MKDAFNVAESYLGLQEFPGAKHNPAVVKMFADSGHSWVKDDETPWCAAFVGSVLAQCGMKGTGGLNARSYLEWGEPVSLDEAQKGDIVVLWRKNRDGPYGHVAFYAGRRLGKVDLLGGNQGDAVSIRYYPLDRVIGIRRAKAPRTSPAQSKTIQATAGTAVATGTAAITGISQLDGTAQIIVAVAAIAAGVGLAIIFRERLRKWARGDR